jgi:hypothetical protein
MTIRIARCGDHFCAIRLLFVRQFPRRKISRAFETFRAIFIWPAQRARIMVALEEVQIGCRTSP